MTKKKKSKDPPEAGNGNGAAATKRRTLDYVQKRKIGLWLEGKRDDFRASRPQYTEVAAMVRAELGLEISPRGLAYLAARHDADWPTRRPGGRASHSLTAQIQEVSRRLVECEAAVQALGADLLAFRQETRGLAEQLGKMRDQVDGLLEAASEAALAAGGDWNGRPRDQA